MTSKNELKVCIEKIELPLTWAVCNTESGDAEGIDEPSIITTFSFLAPSLTANC
jgi:hypothetical protein